MRKINSCGTYSVETKCHSFGVHEQFVGVGLLLLNLKHLLLSETGLLSLEAFLGGTGLLLTFLIFLFLKFVLDLLVSHRDWHWFQFSFECGFDSWGRDILKFITFSALLSEL